MANVFLRESGRSDFSFLRKMLYEAVFWRPSADKPSFEEGLAYPDAAKVLENWGERDGDAAVIAAIDSIPVGAAWYRFWSDHDRMRGYIDENTPVLVIGVHRDYRHRGIGKKMMEWLIDFAHDHAIEKISLSVSKDNYALTLYRQQGFTEHEDKGDYFVMVRDIYGNPEACREPAR